MRNSFKACLWPLALFLLGLLVPAHSSPRPQVVAIVADYLILADTLSPHCPGIAHLRARGQMALMSPGTAHGPQPLLNVYATLGAGDAVAQGNMAQGLLSHTLARSHFGTALLGNADGDDTGPFHPATLLLPPSATIPSSNISFGDSTRPDPLAPGGRRTDPALLWHSAQDALAARDFVVVYDGDFARVARAEASLLPSVYAQSRARALQSLGMLCGFAMAYADTHPNVTLLLVVPAAPMHRNTWDSLTPFICYAHSASRLPLLQSATTQTAGLVAARDFAPTVLALLHVPPPLPMTGAPIVPAPDVANKGALPLLRRMDTLTRLNQQAQLPFFWTVGVLGGAVLLASIGLALREGPAQFIPMRRVLRYGLRALSALPLALLLAPLVPVQTLVVYCAVMAAFIFALALLLPSPSVILGVTALVVTADGFAGTPLIAQSLLSVYALSGIRFYGIGGEYMGVLLAGTLTLAGSAWLAARPRWLTALLFVTVVVVLSFPSLGAKAGGAVTACATFFVAWRALHGRAAGMRWAALGVAAGFAIVLVWGILGHWLPLRRTHIDTATAALGAARFGYLKGIAVRKIGLAAHVATNPGTLAGLLGLGVAAALARRVPAVRFASLHTALPRFAALWLAGLWGGLVCVLFNDSGVVAAILLLTSLALVGLHELLDNTARAG